MKLLRTLWEFIVLVVILGSVIYFFTGVIDALKH
jgi:hypothetical protein